MADTGATGYPNGFVLWYHNPSAAGGGEKTPIARAGNTMNEDTTMTNAAKPTFGRRGFMRNAALGLAGFSILPSRAIRASAANSKIELGIIGGGGRARFVGRKMIQTVGGDIKLVSAHDYFEDHLDLTLQMLDLDPNRCRTGPHGYRDILASDVDGVIITSPPYFHPEQAAEAVGAGKHVWLAKPVAVDVPGCLSIKETGKRAEGKLAFLVDFQSRNSPYFVEAVERVHGGAIGKIISGQAYNQFPAAGFPDVSGLPPAAARIRRWGTDPVLSGDCIVEQAVHAVDIVNWFVGRPPSKAYGTCGLKARLDAGRNQDHFLVTYWYGEDGPAVQLNCSQFMRGGYEDLGCTLFGSLGVADAHYRATDWGKGPVKITGVNPWEGTEHDNTWDIGVENNCRDFVRAIRSGNYMNHAEYSSHSALTAILGREASYRNETLTWDDLLRENKALRADLG